MPWRETLSDRQKCPSADCEHTGTKVDSPVFFLSHLLTVAYCSSYTNTFRWLMCSPLFPEFKTTSGSPEGVLSSVWYATVLWFMPMNRRHKGWSLPDAVEPWVTCFWYKPALINSCPLIFDSLSDVLCPRQCSGVDWFNVMNLWRSESLERGHLAPRMHSRGLWMQIIRCCHAEGRVEDYLLFI